VNSVSSYLNLLVPMLKSRHQIGMVDYFGMSVLLGTVKSAEELTAIAPGMYQDTKDGRAEASRRAQIAWKELEEMSNLIITYPPHPSLACAVSI
jgi:hypothetical protein